VSVTVIFININDRSGDREIFRQLMEWGEID